MQKSNPSARTPASVFSLDGVPAPGQLIPLGLQHVVAAIVGIITPAIMVANTCNLSGGDRTLLIQVSLIVTALATLLQLYTIKHRVGSGLPVVMGISFAYVPTLLAIGGQFDLPTILGAEIVGGCVAIVFGIFVKQIRRLFPPLITGTVIFTIGLSLYPTAVKYMAGGAGSAEFGGLKNWSVALVTLAVVVLLQNFGKGVLKLGAILWGMIVGYVMALCLGMVDFSAVAPAGWFQLAAPLHFGVKFEASACISLAVVYVINAVQTIGDLSSTTMNKVINKAVFAFASLILLAAGLAPKLSAILTTIPQAVIGGATISVFATITMTGIRMITSDHFSMRSSAVVGLSVALGVGITQVAGSLQGPGFPAWVHTVFGSSPIVVTAIMAILLNLLLPKDEAAKSGA